MSARPAPGAGRGAPAAARRASVLPDAAAAAPPPAAPRQAPGPPSAARSARPSVEAQRGAHLVSREEVELIVRETVAHVVGEGVFLLNKLTPWTGNIVEGVLKRLAGLNKPLKYIVTTHLAQRVGAGIHSSAAAFWDPNTDGKVCVVWESPTLQVITTVFYVFI